ncbi:MAG: hypothetical protein OXP75_19890 [Rhodospirillales bacterium]|nr:hypothetical protein [Rhodospirillales bacterium]
MKKTKLTRSLMAACSIVALSAVMYGCVHSGGDDTASDDMDVMEPPPPTAYEAGKAAIMAATTAADAQAAYDAVDQSMVTGAEAASLQAALASQLMTLATMAREAAQKMALSDAAGMIDTSDLSTQDLVDAARTAIAGLRGALANAADVSEADKAMYQGMLDAAVMAVDTAQGGIDTATRRMNQMDALSSASMTLQAALTALAGQAPTQDQIDAASAALAALNSAIDDAADLTADETATYQREADNAGAPISTAQTSLDDAEKTAQDEADRIAAEEAAAAAAAMAITASKLYAGIGATPLLATARSAAYGSGDNAADIAVTIDGGTPVNLSEDDDAMVDDRHGWTGMMFTAEPDGDAGTYESVVYSHIGEDMVTEGQAFNVAYTLDATTGETASVTTLTGHATSRVASPSFDQSAGQKTFKPGDNDVRIMLAGSYQGVSGMYYCTAADRAVGCSATVADMGFTLAGGTWTFKPTDPAAKLMDTSAADDVYASYGWWLHKSEDGETFTASAFHAYRGTDAGTVGIADLRGTATYTGGAAGKYALRSSTGGTNDAGHFTADVMLEATFAEDHEISGTIDNFMGADGMSRDWSVALGASVIADGGAIAGDPDDSTDTDPQMTTWTIGDTAADAAGMWSGDLREQGDDGIPGIATGTFYSTYGLDGRMVGAFGANE